MREIICRRKLWVAAAFLLAGCAGSVAGPPAPATPTILTKTYGLPRAVAGDGAAAKAWRAKHWPRVRTYLAAVENAVALDPSLSLPPDVKKGELRNFDDNHVSLFYRYGKQPVSLYEIGCNVCPAGHSFVTQIGPSLSFDKPARDLHFDWFFIDTDHAAAKNRPNGKALRIIVLREANRF